MIAATVVSKSNRDSTWNSKGGRWGWGVKAREGVSKARGISQVLRVEFMLCMLQLFDCNFAEGAGGSPRL